MDIARLTELGPLLVEKGKLLNEKKAERDALNADIAELEKELTPLVIEHQKLVASLLGTAVPAPPPADDGPMHMGLGRPYPPRPGTPGGGPGGLPTANEKEQAKRKILAFLENAEPGISAYDIAQQLNIDGVLVRQIMFEMAHAPGASPGS
jgi:hypothetical protein